MNCRSVNTFILLIITGCVLAACALSEASDSLSDSNTGSNAPPLQKKVPVDWASAELDEKLNTGSIKPFSVQKNSSARLAVPLLLPSESITLTDMLPPVQTLSPAKIIIDGRGYSAVMMAMNFTVLIDGSNQTFVTEQSSSSTQPLNFDGEYQPISNGGQISIGRYGALYAIQLLCTSETRKNCITERMVREVIESLSVHGTGPR